MILFIFAGNHFYFSIVNKNSNLKIVLPDIFIQSETIKTELKTEK